MIELPILILLGLGALWFFVCEDRAITRDIARRQAEEKEARRRAIQYMLDYARRAKMNHP